MKRAVGVVRVSERAGRNGDSFTSPKVQQEGMAKLCRDRGYRLVKTLDEMDVSGRIPLQQRRGMKVAVDMVERGQADVVLVHMFDRLARNLEVQREVIDRIEQAGGVVLAGDFGEVSNGTAIKKLTATLIGAIHEYVVGAGAEKSREAQQDAIDRGVPPWGRVTPGYRKLANKRYEPDPVTAPVVAKVFEMRADGTTVNAVREFLAANGIERSYHGTCHLLGSRVVLGEIHFGDYEPNLTAHEPIVDRETWLAAQAAPSGEPGPRAASERILARLGVLRCATCAARMVVASSHHGRYPVYRCPPNGECDRHVSISATIAERVITEAARNASDGLVAFRAARENLRQARLAAERAQRTFDLAVEHSLGMEDEPAVRDRLLELRGLRDEARARVNSLGVPDDDVIVLLGKEWDSLSQDDQRRCIRATIKTATVEPAQKGIAPEERIAITYHAIEDWLSGSKPPLPTELS